MREMIERSAEKVAKWVEDRSYRGYDPFDGLSSFLRPFTLHNTFAERLLQQLIRQSPVNLRPLLGVKPLESPVGRGYMVRGYLTMLHRNGNRQYREKAVENLGWLMENRSPKYSKHCWGNHFHYASRAGKLAKYEPTIVWSSLIGQAFLEAYEILEESRYLDVAAGICDWILDLPRERTERGGCLSYVAFEQSSIHNANMLGAAMLSRTAKFTGNKAYLDVAQEAMEYSCSRQLPDWAWYYGEEPKFHWIDNYHTGYNLDSLKCYMESTLDETYAENLRGGFEYFKENFFEENGRPKYYHNRVYPVDIQCASQAITTLALFSDYDESSLELACKVAKWTIENMQDEAGYFYYREFPLIKAKAPMVHWGQTTMYLGLTLLLSKLSP